VFLAGHDASDHDSGTYCVRVDSLVSVGRLTYYLFKLLELLRRLPPPPPPP
jgi:hypothetical protein